MFAHFVIRWENSSFWLWSPPAQILSFSHLPACQHSQQDDHLSVCFLDENEDALHFQTFLLLNTRHKKNVILWITFLSLLSSKVCLFCFSFVDSPQVKCYQYIWSLPFFLKQVHLEYELSLSKHKNIKVLSNTHLEVHAWCSLVTSLWYVCIECQSISK